MTPFLNPTTPAEERFNAALARTRVLIEQTFGILKRRFQILHNEVRAIPTRAIVYIASCATLHNIGINRGDIIDRDEDDYEDPDNNFNFRVLPVGMGGGEGVRRHIVDTYFA